MLTSHQLTPAQKAFYHENGYLLGLPPIFSRDEMKNFNAELPHLLALLEPGESSKDIREWHETSTYLYEIAMNPKIIELVSGILGDNFFCWASNFFIKDPRTLSTVGWHQDSYYWPMAQFFHQRSPHPFNRWLASRFILLANGAAQLRDRLVGF